MPSTSMPNLTLEAAPVDSAVLPLLVADGLLAFEPYVVLLPLPPVSEAELPLPDLVAVGEEDSVEVESLSPSSLSSGNVTSSPFVLQMSAK